jgi:hypothetical protein
VGGVSHLGGRRYLEGWEAVATFESGMAILFLIAICAANQISFVSLSFHVDLGSSPHFSSRSGGELVLSLNS